LKALPSWKPHASSSSSLPRGKLVVVLIAGLRSVKIKPLVAFPLAVLLSLARSRRVTGLLARDSNHARYTDL
jgi:hypothetical protein